HTDRHTHTHKRAHIDTHTHTHSHILDLPHAMNASSLVGQGSGTVKNRKLPNGTGMALLSTRIHTHTHTHTHRPTYTHTHTHTHRETACEGYKLYFKCVNLSLTETQRPHRTP